MKTIVYLVFIFVCFKLFSQQTKPFVIATTGFSSQQNNVQISYTIGETVIHTLETNNNMLTQGFQQPHYNITLIPQQNEINTNFHIYPNPAKDELFIQSPFENETTWEISLFDMSGKCLILNKTDVSPNTTVAIPMHSVAAGKYILTIYVKQINQIIKYDIVKTN